MLVVEFFAANHQKLVPTHLTKHHSYTSCDNGSTDVSVDEGSSEATLSDLASFLWCNSSASNSHCFCFGLSPVTHLHVIATPYYYPVASGRP